MFYLIGLGLCDEKDITVKGLEVGLLLDSGLHLRIKAVRGCSRVYLEAYTSILMIEQTKLVINPRSTMPFCTELCQEEFYGKTLIMADRDTVESDSDTILDGAGQTDVALLVVGDPFGYGWLPFIRLSLTSHACSATTHSDILLRARARNIPTEVIHNASIMNAIGACGLQLYNFGQAVSLVFFTETWKPDSFYDRIAENWRLGMHTLLLLDIKVKEQSEENLARYVTSKLRDSS